MDIQLISSVIIFLFGAIVGSFLNVVALRYNTGHSLNGRSSCPSCTRTLLWYELVPMFSFMYLKGRCRTCGSFLSLQYPTVELLTGIIFTLLFLKFSISLLFVYTAVLASIYIVIGIYDIRHTIVPNGLAYGVALITFSALFIDFDSVAFTLPTIMEILAGPLVALPLFLLWLVSRGRWMGLGDAKLMLSIGWVLGTSSAFAGLLLAFWTGALYGLFILSIHRLFSYLLKETEWKRSLFLLKGRRTMKSEIAFAPFLLLGFAIVFFLDINILDLILWDF